MAGPELVFPSVPDEGAIAALKRRGINFMPSGHWTEVWQNAHHTGFTVAQSAGFDVLADIHGALLKAEEDGWTFARFRRELVPLLQKKGWWGRIEKEDPQTGEVRNVQLGSVRRLRTIFDVNARVSAAQGDWERQQELKDVRPYLRYVQIDRPSKRLKHVPWHNRILPVDHPWWKTHYPPNGWKCGCKTMSVSEDDLRTFGWAVSGEPPDDGFVFWQNPRTGEMLRVPAGIDPGWAYNPGNTDQAAHAAKLAMDKLVTLPPSIASSAVTKLAFTFPQVERELGAWIENIAAKASAGEFRPTGARRVVGAFSGEVLLVMASEGLAPTSAAITISDSDIMHALRTVKADPLPEDVWKRLPGLLAHPAAVYWDLQNPGLVYVLNEPEGRGKLVVLVDYEARVERKQVRVNTIRTGKRIESLEEFDNPGRYVRVW